MNPAFGYIIMEGNTGGSDGVLENVNVVRDNGLFFLRFDTTLQSLNVPNRNKRWYGQEGIKQALESAEIQELIAMGRWEGEAGHPDSEKISRIAQVDPKLTCHKIVKYWFEGNLLKATIETLDDGLYGTKLTKRVLQGGASSYSLRALASLEKEGNLSYVRRAPRIITYDEVQLPSHKEAYYDGKTKKNVIKDINGNEIVSEGTGAGRIIAIDDKLVKEQLMNNSDNLKIICESFDLDATNLDLRHNGGALGLKDRATGETFVFQLESTAFSKVRDGFRRFM